ncbi:hypothetical protein [Actinoplanes siamensis]|uniref:Uncharacterized protein n=1 Tax=Actinoplanes siamensis TaxID=1223317 RepID=A0A919N4C2_9ACTN|nr:hypothetical protein [Actinoplanes siamensis]GIF04151.1 hypothetical protein Asi03nite_16890 [Actinoplanes siamensis]
MDAYRKAVTVAAVALIVSAALAAVFLSRFGSGSVAGRSRPGQDPAPAARPHTGLGARPEYWPGSSGPEAELEFTHRDDLTALELTGQYAAELATGRSGAGRVLAEHQLLRRSLASDEHPVVLLRSTDLAHPAGEAGSWLTVALGDFPDPRSVTAWCDTVSAPHCVPRRLDPPR